MIETLKIYGNDLFPKLLFLPLWKYDITLIDLFAEIDVFHLAFQRL